MSSTGFFDVPVELQEEILSYLPSGEPPTLQGLQLGLTCKALYKIFRPVIVKIQVGRLLEAIKTSRLEIHRLLPQASSQPHSQNAPFRFSENHEYNSVWRSERGPLSQRNSEATICHIFYLSGSEELDIPASLFPDEATHQYLLSERPNMYTASQKDTPRGFYWWHNPEFDCGISYTLDSRRSGAMEEIWGLHSLISRSKRLRRIFLRLYRPKDVGREWTRAFLELLKVCAEKPGIEISIVDPTSFSTDWHDRNFNERIFEKVVRKPSTALSSISSSLQQFRKKYSNTDILATRPALLQPTDLVVSPKDFATSRLSSLSLSGQGGGTFDRWHYPALHHLVIQSYSTLTRLHINLGPNFEEDWRELLSWWKFPQLSHFSIRESRVPLDALILFLQCHPTLTNVSLWVHYHIHDSSAVPPLKEIKENFLPDVREMVASPSLLVHILSSTAPSSSKFPFKKKIVNALSSVEQLTISQEQDFTGGSHNARKFEYISRVLSLIAARPHNTTIMPKLSRLSMCVLYQANEAFKGWLHEVIEQDTVPAAGRTSQSSASKAAGSAKNASHTITNLPLHGIPEFWISGYLSPEHDQVHYGPCMLPTMDADFDLVMGFIARLFRSHDGGSMGGLKRVVLSDICMNARARMPTNLPWREMGGLEEVKYSGGYLYGTGVDQVWSRPSELS